MKQVRTSLSEIEQGIAKKIGGARYPPATASKRFAQNCAGGYIKELSPQGRRFMAFIAHRYRRQYALTSAELDWISEWLQYEEYEVPAAPKPVEEPNLPGIVEAVPEQLSFDEL